MYVCLCMYVCMYVCMCIFMFVTLQVMYVCMYVCMYVWCLKSTLFHCWERSWHHHRVYIFVNVCMYVCWPPCPNGLRRRWVSRLPQAAAAPEHWSCCRHRCSWPRHIRQSRSRLAYLLRRGERYIRTFTHTYIHTLVNYMLLLGEEKLLYGLSVHISISDAGRYIHLRVALLQIFDT